MIYLKLIILLISSYQVFSSSCCNKCCLSPNKKKTKEEESKRIEAFKNKIFLPVSYIQTEGYFLLKFSDKVFQSIDKNYSNVNFKHVYRNNFNLINGKEKVDSTRDISIIVPIVIINDDRFQFDSSTNYIYKIKDEGKAVYFYYTDDKTKLYVYLKGIRKKLGAKKNEEANWHIEKFKWEEGEINFGKNENIFDSSWYVIKAYYVTDDLIELTFHNSA